MKGTVGMSKKKEFRDIEIRGKSFEYMYDNFDFVRQVVHNYEMKSGITPGSMRTFYGNLKKHLKAIKICREVNDIAGWSVIIYSIGLLFTHRGTYIYSGKGWILFALMFVLQIIIIRKSSKKMHCLTEEMERNHACAENLGSLYGDDLIDPRTLTDLNSLDKELIRLAHIKMTMESLGLLHTQTISVWNGCKLVAADAHFIRMRMERIRELGYSLKIFEDKNLSRFFAEKPELPVDYSI